MLYIHYILNIYFWTVAEAYFYGSWPEPTPDFAYPLNDSPLIFTSKQMDSMEREGTTRKLAPILSTDVKEYRCLIRQDKMGTMLP